MRSSHATWVFVAIVAAATCMQTGCGFTRLGRNVSNMSIERPRLLSWRRNKREAEVASSTRPPSSSIPPAGDPGAGSSSRDFPSEPAPSGNHSYASTNVGSGNYPTTSGAGGSYDRTGGYDDTYVASGGGSEAGAQRGFYDPNYGGASGGSGYGDTASRDAGYDNYGGASRDYGPSYAGRDTENYYQQVADQRGGSYDNTYGGNDSSYENTSGGSGYVNDRYSNEQYGNGQYGADQYSNDPYGSQTPASYSSEAQYNTQGGSRFVSPNGSGNVDDYRSPAQGSYEGSYDNGGSYDNNYSAPASSGDSPRWFPGSTKNVAPYDQQQQLAPPTNNGWGGN